MFQILVTLSFQESGGSDFAMTTNTVEFASRQEADVAYDRIADYYPRSAIYATVVKLY